MPQPRKKKRSPSELKIEQIKKIVDDYFDNVRYYSDSNDLAQLWAQNNMASIQKILDDSK